MPLSVAFRWKSPNIQASQPNSVKNGWDKSLTQAAQAISDAKQYRFNKREQERRNKIEDEDRARRIDFEDEDRARRIDFEDRQRAAWKESADLMRGAAQERDALVKEKAELEARIAQLGG